MADVNLNIGGDTRRLEADIRKAVSRSYSIDLKTTGSQPLGRITSQLSEFNKSLEASNARVIAFGASAGVIFGLQSAFAKLISTTIEVQKSLADINVILNVSSSEIQKFGDQLFSIARNTGQSFNEVATAATEFSRQGLGVEETLKRTNEALILARLSGLDTAKSVEALTAAVNSFASQAVTATEIVNKFANVDAAFAVSSADLAEAISRVGSSAAQSGVNLDELISIVTSAQQTTARGGAVIGNSFKTIFTRLQRGDVVDLLDSLGVSTMDSQGQLKSTINLLEDLATIYDKLGTLQQAEVAEKVGGVFQINILKAALADLGKEYSVYDRALEISASSTDQAIQRNEELNKTYAAQINILKENVAQLSQTAGTRVIGPSFDRVVGGANDILGLVNESDGQGVGAALGKGILDGIGQILAGPGLALIGGVLIKLFKDFTVYASGSVKELLGLNNASKHQVEIQQSINSIIAQNPQLLQLMAQGTRGVNDAAQLLLQSLQQQTLELQKQDALTSKVASQLYKGGVRIRGGVPTATQTRADGYIPAFSKESRDVQRGVGGARASDVPIGPFNINGEPTIINSGEKLVPDFGGSGETAILTRDMQKSVSMAEGYVPNFAIDRPYARAKRSDLLKKKPGNEDYDAAQAELALRGGETFDADKILGFKLPGLLVPPGGAGKGIITKQNLLGDDNNIKFDFPVASLQIQGNQKLQQEAEKMFLVDDNFITQFVDKQVLPFTHALANTIGSPPADPKTTRNIAGVKGLKGSIEGALGSIFDAALISAVGEASTEPDGGDFDVRAAGPQFGYIDKLFQGGRGVLGGASNNLGDFKKSAGPDATNSMVAKTLKEYPNKFKPKIDNTQKNKAKKTRSRATGYIPNFADALNEAVQRELDQSGLPKNQIYVSQKQALVAPENPSGLGVFNKRDEGSTSKEKRAVRNRSSGYIPNFAEPAPQDLSSTIGALSIQLLSFAGVLALTGKQTKSAGAILPQAIRSINKDLRSSLAAELVERRRLASELRVGNDLELQARLSLAKNLPKGSEARQALAQEISARRSALNQLRAANNQEFKARLRAAKQINVFQKGVAIAGSKLAGRGSVLGFGVQIAAETARNAIPETSKAGRVGGALVGAVGSAASGAALGLTFGPKGAAIGAVAGAALGLADVFKQLTSNLPELQAALDKASQQITKTQDSNSRLLQTYEAYTKALDSGDAELIKKTQAEYENALSGSTQEQRDVINGSLTLADAQLKLAEILNKQAKEVADAAVGIEIEKIGGISSSTYVGRGDVGFRAESFIKKKNQPEIDATASLLADTINSSVKDVDIKAGLSAKLSEQLSGIQVTDASGKLIKNSQAISSVIDNLEKEMGVKLPDALRTMLVNSVLSGASVDVLTAALDQVSTAAQDAADVVANANKPLSDMIRKLRADFIAALDAATNAISSTIDFTSGLQSTENNLINTQKAFERSFALTEQVSGPKSVAEQITGKDSMLSITFALQEALGQIELGRMEGVESTASSTGENIYGTIGEAVKKEIENLIATGPGTIRRY
jgi:TP901 family phage tail tape measure protein